MSATPGSLPNVGRLIPLQTNKLRRALLQWWPTNGRSYPWRQESDPYLRLVAEVLLERTRAGAVERVWSSFTRRYPTPKDLANASLSDIAAVVSSLGLAKKRSRYLKALGQELEGLGRVPGSKEALLALTGIGPYSAAAFLIGHRGRRLPAVDSNVRRVLGRVVYGIDSASAGDALSLQTRLLSRGDPSKLLFAILDLGASPCRPRSPICEECPARSFCRFSVIMRKTAAGVKVGEATQSS